MQVHCVYRLYGVHVYVHEKEKKKKRENKKKTCVLTYTYSVRSLFCGEERPSVYTMESIYLLKNNAQQFDQRRISFVIFLKDYRAIVLVS